LHGGGRNRKSPPFLTIAGVLWTGELQGKEGNKISKLRAAGGRVDEGSASTHKQGFLWGKLLKSPKEKVGVGSPGREKQTKEGKGRKSLHAVTRGQMGGPAETALGSKKRMGKRTRKRAQKTKRLTEPVSTMRQGKRGRLLRGPQTEKGG